MSRCRDEDKTPSPSESGVGEKSNSLSEGGSRIITKKDYSSKFIEGFSAACNSKVRYYCIKTLQLDFSLGEMIDDLVEAQRTAMAFLVQEPPSSDHFVLSFVFHLIEKTVTLINWGELNHDCFWKDFKRHTKVLSNLIDSVQMVTHDATHTAVDKYNRASDILQHIVTIPEHSPDPRLQAAAFQAEVPYGDILSQSIKVTSVGPNETIYIEWSNIGHSKPQVITLQKTQQNFRLRFLRCLVYFARKALTLLQFTMSRLDTAMLTETHLTKIALCNEMSAGQLTPYEKYALMKSKKEFDSKWKDISETIHKIKLRVGLLDDYRQNSRKLLKDPSSCPKLKPAMESVTLMIKWPTFIRIMGDAIMAEMDSESYDFSMYTDRTEDILEIIQSLWKVDRTSHQIMDALLNMIYIGLRTIAPNLYRKEVNYFKSVQDQIDIQRSRLKRYLNRALEIFEHRVFRDIPINQNGFSKTAIRLRGRGTPAENEESDDEDSSGDEESVAVEPNIDGVPFWVEVNGGYRLAITDQKELLIKNQVNTTMRFDQLNDEQQSYLGSILCERLIHHLAEEVAKAKVRVEDANETKSLLKYLKQRDRELEKEKFATAIGNGVSHMQEMIMLTNVMKMLRSISLRFPDT